MIRAPKHWTSNTIGDVTLPVDKHRPEEEPLREFQYIDISSIDNDRHIIVEPKTLIGKDAPSRARQVVRAGDTVLSTVRTYLKNTAMVPTRLDGATASTGFSVLRPDSDQIEPRFLYYRVVEESFVAELSEKQTGTSYPAVRDRDVRSMPVSYPTLGEQQGIVEAIEEQFSRLDAGVESLHRARRNLVKLRSALLSAAVDTAQSLSAPAIALDDALTEIRYGTSTKCSYDGQGPAVLRIPNIRESQVSVEDLKFAVDPEVDLSRFAAHSGDLLFVRTNGSRDLVGRVGVVGVDAAGMAFASYLIRGRPVPEVDPHFISTVLSSPAWRLQLTALASTSAGQYNISATKLKSVRIPIPPLVDQLRIVTELDYQTSMLNAVCMVIEASTERSSSLRSSILRAAFAGRPIAEGQMTAELTREERTQRGRAKTMATQHE